MRGNKKGFYRYISSKRKTRGNTGLLMDGTGDLMTKVTGNAEVLDVLFTLVFTDTTYTQQLHVHVEKSGARKTSPRRRRIMLGNIYKWTYISPWDLIGCTQEC